MFIPTCTTIKLIICYSGSRVRNGDVSLSVCPRTLKLTRLRIHAYKKIAVWPRMSKF